MKLRDARLPNLMSLDALDELPQLFDEVQLAYDVVFKPQIYF